MVRGEGEITSCELVQAIDEERTSDFKTIKGISFKSEEPQKVVNTPDRVPMDMDSLSGTEYTLLYDIREVGMAKFAESVEIPIQTSRGCPYRCAFCINTVLRNKYRYRRTDLVLDDLEKLVSSGAKKIFFMDECFFNNKKRVKGIMEGIKERELVFEWFGNIRVDFLKNVPSDQVLLKKIRESGCVRMGIGAESGSKRMLDKIKKDITVQEILDSCRILDRAGIRVLPSFMIGMPGETYMDMVETIKLIAKIKLSEPSSYILGPQIYRPYPGSQLFFECVKSGLTIPSTLDEWSLNTSLLTGTVQSKEEYPWISDVEKMSTLLFYYSMGYGNLSMLAGKFRLLKHRWFRSAIAKIGKFRIKRSFYRFPVEKKLYYLIRS